MSEMSETERAKLAGVAASAAALTSSAPADVGTAAVGTGTTAARADHVHGLPNVGSAGTVGTAGLQGVTTDAQGRVTAATAAPGAGYRHALTGAERAYEQVFKTSGIDLLTLAQTSIVPVITGKRVIPRDVTIRITAITGVIIVAPIVRAGNNGSWNNVSPLHTLAASSAQDVDQMTLNAQVTAVDVNATAISIDVQTAGTGATVLTAEVVVGCLVV